MLVLPVLLALCLLTTGLALAQALKRRRLARELHVERDRHRQTGEMLLAVRRQLQERDATERVQRSVKSLLPARREEARGLPPNDADDFDPFASFGFQPTQLVRQPAPTR